MKFCYLMFFFLLVACVPAHSSDSATETTPQTSMAQLSIPTQLLGTTLNAPETNAQIIIDDALLAGTLTDLQSNPKGTIKLSSLQFLQIADTEFWVLPATVQYVSGAGGVYLFLLEQSGSTFTQKQAVNLGNRLELVGLKQANNQLISTTLDPRMGKPPFNQIPSPNTGKPGKKIFELRDGQLVEVN